MVWRYYADFYGENRRRNKTFPLFYSCIDIGGELNGHKWGLWENWHPNTEKAVLHGCTIHCGLYTYCVQVVSRQMWNLVLLVCRPVEKYMKLSNPVGWNKKMMDWPLFDLQWTKGRKGKNLKNTLTLSYKATWVGRLFDIDFKYAFSDFIKFAISLLW